MRQLTRSLSALVFILVPACGPLGDPPPRQGGPPSVMPAPPVPYPTTAPGYRSGTRLSTLWVTFPDGAQVYLAMYDNVLKVPCHVGPADDGQMRCIPSPQAWATQHLALGTYKITP